MTTIEIQEKYNVSPLVARVLALRNLEPWQMEQVLHPESELRFSYCEAIEGMILRILKAKESGEKVFIGGDYDADGLCATTIMKETLDRLEIENGFYIPDRFTHGYGLHPDTVQMVADKGYSVIITVDNGVAAKEAIDLARKLNIEILITDHHAIQEELNWNALLHPSLMEPEFHAMCGAGVALQLSRRLIGENRKHTILAMVATLADMMPLFNENRRIVQVGLRYLNEDRFAQLEALLDRPVKVWDEKEISFQIVPKINAIGRLSDKECNPNNVVRYFLANQTCNIEEAAAQIKAINNQRRQLSEKMANKALSMVTEDAFAILDDEQFHEGLVGLIANKVMQHIHRPTAVFAMKEESYKGSARSNNQLDLMEFFDEFKPMMEAFGGHRAAVGLEVKKENFEAFKTAVQKKMETVELSAITGDSIAIHSVECTPSAIFELKSLAPFGQGFEMPVFTILDFELIQSQVLKERYPKWQCRNADFEFEAISFNLPKESTEKKITRFIGQLSVNEFRGKKTVSVLVESVE